MNCNNWCVCYELAGTQLLKNTVVKWVFSTISKIVAKLYAGLIFEYIFLNEFGHSM